MASPVQNGNSVPESSNGPSISLYQSSGESSSSTLKSSSEESPGKTSCKDTDHAGSSSETCKASNSDLDHSSLSDNREDDQLCEVADSKKSLPEASSPSKDEETEDTPTDKKDDQTEAEPQVEQPSVKAEESDYNNFADNEDSCCNTTVVTSTVMKVQEMLENFRNIRTPKDVNIGKVINRRRRRKRSQTGKNSPFDGSRQSKKQRGATGGDLSSSESSQDSRVFVKAIGPTKFSSELFSKSANLSAGKGPSSSTKAKSSASSHRSNTKAPDESQDPKSIPGCSRTTEVSKSVKRKTPCSLPSTSKDAPLPLSPLPSTPEDEEPSQYPSALLAVNLHGNPHASRVNALTSLLDRVVSFSDHMESISMFSDPDPPPHSGEGNRNLRELHEDFRNCCDTLSSSEVQDEEEASASLIESVRHLKHQSSALCDRYCYSHDGRRVPRSEGPLSIEEIRYHLPRLWDSLMTNNMIMNQWTCTLLDWCLKTTPECHPQQFYDTEAGTRNLFRDINEVHCSVNNLLNRWNSRDMHLDELADLTYLHTLSTTATSLYSVLEAEVINIRYNLGTRQPARLRRSDEEANPEEKDQGPSKKGKKE